MVNRNKKLAFIEVTNSGGETVYKRLTGFTEFTVNLNPREYTRKYIDELAERSEVVGYHPSISYKFDMELGNEAQEQLVFIADKEVYGEMAVVKLAIVDTSEETNEALACFRNYNVVPDIEGDDTDVYTYSGTLKATGEKSYAQVKTRDRWNTCTLMS